MRKFYIYKEAAARNEFLLGGGNAEDFPGLYKEFMDESYKFVDKVRKNKYISSGGRLLYLVLAKKSS
jgi:hypothetical protein